MGLYLFFEEVLNRKSFYFPVAFFVLVGYSFSIYNRTISIDDLLLNDSGLSAMLIGRWGMYVWAKFVGFTEMFPFVFRFLALLFYIIAAILFCFVLYSIGGSKSVISYTICASAFVSYPLIHEIFEYEVSYMVTGNLCLVTLAAIVIRSRLSVKTKILWASLLIELPISSYESAIFYYITLVCIIILYEYIANHEMKFEFMDWVRKNLLFFIPVIVALAIRIAIHVFIYLIFGLKYLGNGANGILWIEDSFLHVLKCMAVFTIVDYFLCALIYLPITIFLLSLFFFIFSLSQVKNKRRCVYVLGLMVVISLFSQSLLQGYSQPGRTSQVFTLFIAFSFYLLVVSSRVEWRKYIYVVLFGLCWYQSVYLNKLLCLNNLRSENELAAIRQIGNRIQSEFEKKPVAFVGDIQVSKWILDQITINEISWNGHLFCSVYDNFITEHKRPYKYIGSNVISASMERHQLQAMFSYCGYDIEIYPDYSPYMTMETVGVEKCNRIQATVEEIAKEQKMRPYQIFDNGDYLIVNLGEDN